jgi:hypothetical protein
MARGQEPQRRRGCRIGGPRSQKPWVVGRPSRIRALTSAEMPVWTAGNTTKARSSLETSRAPLRAFTGIATANAPFCILHCPFPPSKVPMWPLTWELCLFMGRATDPIRRLNRALRKATHPAWGATFWHWRDHMVRCHFQRQAFTRYPK